MPTSLLKLLSAGQRELCTALLLLCPVRDSRRVFTNTSSSAATRDGSLQQAEPVFHKLQRTLEKRLSPSTPAQLEFAHLGAVLPARGSRVITFRTPQMFTQRKHATLGNTAL